MKSWKLKILLPIILVGLLVGSKFVLWDFPISSGKRVGNLTKFSKKGKFWFTKTWEGTIDEGSGDKLTSYFSVRDEGIAQELYSYEGREVIIYYEQYLLGWPRDTNYNVVSWKPKVNEIAKATQEGLLTLDEKLIQHMGKTLFCSLLGSLYQDQELYQKVKEYIKKNNLYLYKQYGTCNE
jgi:hypothetical protein